MDIRFAADNAATRKQANDEMLVEREIAKWGPLIKAAGISVD
jgi:hypothetical protein